MIDFEFVVMVFSIERLQEIILYLFKFSTSIFISICLIIDLFNNVVIQLSLES